MNTKYDILVIGGGPAGMMAAITAAREGASVGILEKSPRVGQKLRITGKGRCNMTNGGDLNNYMEKIYPQPKFCYSMFSQFFVEDTLDFFHGLNIATKQERGRRVFPLSEKSIDVVNTLYDECRRLDVDILNHRRVSTIKHNEDGITGVVINENEFVAADAVILAAGGSSYPDTGSSGDSFELAKLAGHKISEPFPALLALTAQEHLPADLQGVSLKNAQASLFIKNKLKAKLFGEMLFTHKGLSGPIILTLSRTAVSALNKGDDVRIELDLKPALDMHKLDERLIRELTTEARKKLKTMLKNLLPAKMILPCCHETGLDPEKPCYQITAEERKTLRNWLKCIPFTITAHDGWDHAIITAGGVNLKQINPATMESKLLSNLFFAGECINLDADTGGYNLQIAWSSGFVAGKHAAESCHSK